MRVLIIRQGYAVGDAIFISAMPRLLKEQEVEHVSLAIIDHNRAVFMNNPYVDELVIIPSEILSQEDWAKWLNDRGMNYDKVLAVAGHVEMTFLHKTDSSFGAIPPMSERLEKAKGQVYIDYIFNQMGFEGSGFLPEFYFSDEEKEKQQVILENKRNRKEKLVLWQWEGSSKSKILHYAPAYLEAVLKMVPNSQHFIYTNLPNQVEAIPRDDRCHLINGKWGIRESIVATAVADLVIGPESFWVNAAAAFNTPKLIFFSHSHPENLAKYYKNCWAVVPMCECSPCYLICADYRDIWHPPERRAVARAYEAACQTWDSEYQYRTRGYKCCTDLPHENIIAQIVQILKHGPKEKAKKPSKKQLKQMKVKGNGGSRELFCT